MTRLGAEDAIISMGRACSRLSADERALRRLTLESPMCVDPESGWPISDTARELALSLLDWQPEPLAD
jgi:hypothetical protein